MNNHARKKHAALLLFIGMILLIYILAGSTSQPSPEASQGTLDASEHDFDSFPLLKLNGEWEMYWKQYVSPEHFVREEAPTASSLDTLPAWWNLDTDGYKAYPLDGYASYHLKVTLPESEVGKKYAVSTIDSAFNFRLYINTELVAQRGRPGRSADSYTPDYRNITERFTVPDESFHVTVHISMFGDRNAGMARAFTIGPEDAIRNESRASMLFDAFLLGIVSVLAVYHLLLFSLRSKDMSPLLFAALCLDIGFRNLFQNSKFIFFLFPEINQWLYVKLWYNSYYVMIPLFLLFFYSLFPRQLNRLVTALYTGVSLVFVVLTFLTPLSFFSKILNYYHILFIMITVYTVYATIRAIQEGETGADIMLGGFLLIILFACNDILHNMGYLDTGYYASYGFILFIVSQTYLLSHRFSAAFSKVEFLSSDLQKTNSELERVNRLKDEFLANTSHELKTPLNGIIGIAESLTSAEKYADPELKNNLDMIITSGKRLSSLVNDLLDLEKIKSNEITLDIKQINMYEQVQLVIEHFRHVCRQKNMELVNQLQKEDSFIEADEHRVQQILFNLIGNAVKFTDRGSVTVSGKEKSTEQGSFFAVSVSDTGVGIPEAEQSHIFDPFFQVDGSITRSYEGSGLGLPISKLIVEKHGGWIDLDSKPGQGSVFTFSLPVYRSSAGFSKSVTIMSDNSASKSAESTAYYDISAHHPNAYSLEPPRESIENSTIMIVDDDPINVRILANQLSNSNTTKIIESRDGSEAIEYIEGGGEPDLILLDIMMPRMSGYEVARRIRNTHKLFDIPIIMLTARDNIQDIITAFQSGANDYLTKPFNSFELITRINTHLSLKKAIVERQKLISYEKDIAIASEIQTNTLKSSLPVSEHFTIAVKYVPMKGIGGDFYGFHRISENRLGILIADVCGHGIHAALIASMIKVIFSTLRPFAEEPVKFLTQMNSIIMRNTEYSYLTAVYALLDTETMSLSYSRAGHEPPLILRRSTGKLESSKIHGRIIGFSEDVNFETGVLKLEKNDRILLFTDGIEETSNPGFELFGQERFHELIKDCTGKDGPAFAEELIHKLRTWSTQNDHFDDDITLISIDV